MPAALAIVAHPDDTEFVIAGSLLLLRERGWDIHYCNVSTGNMGSTVMSARETARVRLGEGKAAARLLGAKFHPPICNDLSNFYTEKNIRRLCAVVRAARPEIVFTHSLEDYMEDHMITARLTVTATFARGIPNYRSHPQRKPHLSPCTIYHAMPHGQTTPMREPVNPELYVDTTAVHAMKRDALSCHASQKEWLDKTQGKDSYLAVLDRASRRLGEQTGRFTFAEGFRRHLHYGFGEETDDPLRTALGDKLTVLNKNYPAPLRKK